MRICAYVQHQYAKQTYTNECMDARQFAGLMVIIDCLTQAGYSVEFAGIATVHTYDVVLVSLTSDCDWWSFISERQQWRKGDYTVIVGGAGVLHVAPFLPWFDVAMFGRGEHNIVPLVNSIAKGECYDDESILYADSFNADKIYRVAQTDKIYPRTLKISSNKEYTEDAIGCNHKCLFCGYTWQRRFISQHDDYKIGAGLFNMADKERAMLDLAKDPNSIDFKHLRTTAIDGFSERLRCGVNKRITRDIMSNFLDAMLAYTGAPHQIKFFNICGYPSETQADWFEFLDTLKEADAKAPSMEKSGALFCIQRHSDLCPLRRWRARL